MIRTSDMTDLETIRVFFNDLMLRYRSNIPAIVDKVNTVDGKVWSLDCRVAIRQKINIEDGENKYVELPILHDVPFLLPYAQESGLLMTIPVKSGDSCLITVADRSIDDWQFFNQVSNPVETSVPRLYDLSDAVAILGAVTRPKAIENYSQDAIEIRDISGTTKIKLKSGTIELIVNDTSVTLGSDSIDMKVGGVNVAAISSALFNVLVPLQSPSVMIGGVDFGAHVHGGVTTGGGNTGGPQ